MGRCLVMMGFIALAFGCTDRTGDSGPVSGTTADTILYAGGGFRFPGFVNGFGSAVSSLAGNRGLLFRSGGAGKSIWIDSILYVRMGSKGLFMIARTVQSLSAICYNGDSLQEILIEPDGSNPFRLDSAEGGKYSYVMVSDSIFSFGAIIRSYFYFKVDSNGTMPGCRSFFPSTGISDRRYDFLVSDSVCPDRMVIKNYFPDKDSLVRINL